MAIHPDDIDQVRRLTDITAIVSERTPLVHVGRRQVGNCPFCGAGSDSLAVNKPPAASYAFRASNAVMSSPSCSWFTASPTTGLFTT